MHKKSGLQKRLFDRYIELNRFMQMGPLASKIIITTVEFLNAILHISIFFNFTSDEIDSRNTIIRDIASYINVFTYKNDSLVVYIIVTVIFRLIAFVAFLFFLLLTMPKYPIFHLKYIKLVYNIFSVSSMTFLIVPITHALLHEMLIIDRLSYVSILTIIFNTLGLFFLLLKGFIDSYFKRPEYFNKEDNYTTINDNFHFKSMVSKVIIGVIFALNYDNYPKWTFAFFLTLPTLIVLVNYVNSVLSIQFERKTTDIWYSYITGVYLAVCLVCILLYVYSSLSFVIWVLVTIAVVLFLTYLIKTPERLTQLYKNPKSPRGLKYYIINSLRIIQNSAKSVKHSMLLKKWLLDHEIGCKNFECYCKDHKLYQAKNYKHVPIENQESIRLMAKYILCQKIIDLLNLDPKNTKNYLLILIWYYEKVLKNKVIAAKHLIELSAHFLNLGESFDFYVLCKNLNFGFDESGLKKFNDKEIEEFLRFSQFIELLKFKLSALVNSTIEFWNVFVYFDNLPVNELIKSARGVLELKAELKKIWRMLMPYLTSDKKLDLLYKIYRIEFENEYLELNIGDHLYDDDESHILLRSNMIFGAYYHKFFFDKHSCIVDLSLNDNSLGIINQVTTNVQNLFSYDKEDLEGFPIDKLIPKSICEAHDHILRSVAFKGKFKRKDQTLQVYAIDKNNKPVEIRIFYKPYMGSDVTLNIISFITPYVSRESRSRFFIMTDEAGFIQTFSKQLENLFSITQLDCRTNDINIGIFGSNFLDNLEYFSSKIEKERLDVYSFMTTEFEKYTKNSILSYCPVNLVKKLKVFLHNLRKKGTIASRQNSLIEQDSLEVSEDKQETNVNNYLAEFIELIKQTRQNISLNDANNIQQVVLEYTYNQKKYRKHMNLNLFIVWKVSKAFKQSLGTAKSLTNLGVGQQSMVNSFSEVPSELQTGSRSSDAKNIKHTWGTNKEDKEKRNMFNKSENIIPKPALASYYLLSALTFIMAIGLIIIGWSLKYTYKTRKINSFVDIENNVFYGISASVNFYTAHSNLISPRIPDYPFNLKIYTQETDDKMPELLEDGDFRNYMSSTAYEELNNLNFFNNNGGTVQPIYYNLTTYYVYKSFTEKVNLNKVSPLHLNMLRNLNFSLLNDVYYKIVTDYLLKVKDSAFGDFKALNSSKGIQIFIIIAIASYMAVGLIIFIFLIKKEYKKGLCLVKYMAYIDKSFALNVINYYKSLTEKLNTSFHKFCSIKEPTTDDLKAEDNEFKGSKSISKMKIHTKSYINSRIRKAIILSIAFLILLFLLEIVQIIVLETFNNNFYDIVVIGTNLAEDTSKLIALLVSAKSYFIDTDFFDSLTNNYKQWHIDDSMLNFDAIYEINSDFAEEIRNYYSTPVCDLEINKEDYKGLICREVYSGFLTNNMITIKSLLPSRLRFIEEKQDIVSSGITKETIVELDKTLVYIHRSFHFMISRWFSAYDSYIRVVRIYQYIILGASILFIFLFSLLMKYIIISPIQRDYYGYRKIYMHFMPQKTLIKNKFIGVKLFNKGMTKKKQ